LKRTFGPAFFISVLSFLSFALPLQAGYPPDPPSNFGWGYTAENSVADIQNRFNAARVNENAQLGTSIPMMSLPSQSVWNNKSDGEKALWLINRERVDRGVAPLHGIEANVTSVAQTYAQYLMDHDVFSHDADGRTPFQRLLANPAINACRDSFMAENLAGFWGNWTLPVERAVYLWMYADSGSSWGHRHILLWYPFNDNGGPPGKEGFIGIGRATGTFGTYQNSNVIVMDAFDPCSAWDYASLNVPGDFNGNGSLGLEDAILALRVLAQRASGATLYPAREPDQDGKVGMQDVLYILQTLAELR
jgi:uncharacterized protein YkwD